MDIESPLGIPVVVDAPANGTVLNPLDSTFTYTPDSNFVGLDTFSYAICNDDVPALCDTAFVFITVNPVINTINVTIPEDSLFTICSDELTIFNSPASTILICDVPSNGSALVTGDCITYTPGPDYVGSDTFCVIVCHPDIPTMCDTSIIIMIVTPVDDGPTAVDDVEATEEGIPVIIDVLANDSDPDSPLGIPSVIDGPTNGSVTVNGDSTITYTPDLNFIGLDTFTYSICDNSVPLLCDTSSVFINVIAGDTINMTIPQDSMIEMCVSLIVQLDGPIDFMIICNAPENGTLIFVDTCVQYIQNPGFSGEDTTCVKVCTVEGACDSVVIIIIVELPLAVNWLSFDVAKMGSYAELKWKTTDEWNNAGFDIEKSPDGVNYLKIGEVAASISTENKKTYTFQDRNPFSDNNYYRIRQNDTNGKF